MSANDYNVGRDGILERGWLGAEAARAERKRKRQETQDDLAQERRLRARLAAHRRSCRDRSNAMADLFVHLAQSGEHPLAVEYAAALADVEAKRAFNVQFEETEFEGWIGARGEADSFWGP